MARPRKTKTIKNGHTLSMQKRPSKATKERMAARGYGPKAVKKKTDGRAVKTEAHRKAISEGLKAHHAGKKKSKITKPTPFATTPAQWKKMTAAQKKAFMAKSRAKEDKISKPAKVGKKPTSTAKPNVKPKSYTTKENAIGLTPAEWKNFLTVATKVAKKYGMKLQSNEDRTLTFAGPSLKNSRELKRAMHREVWPKVPNKRSRTFK